MKKGLKYFYDHLEAYVIVACLVVTTVLIFLQVILRYVFNYSLLWAEELSRYLFVWESWLGISMGARMGEHITVEMFVGKLHGRSRLIVSTLADIAVFTISAIVAWQGIKMCINLSAMGSITPVLKISKAIPYAAVPVGCGLMCIRSIETIINRYRNYCATGLADSEGKG